VAASVAQTNRPVVAPARSAADRARPKDSLSAVTWRMKNTSIDSTEVLG
jgi:hypothetical protein